MEPMTEVKMSNLTPQDMNERYPSSRALTEEQVSNSAYQDLKKHRQRSGWFQWYAVCTRWAALTLVLPFYLSFNPRTGRYVMETSKRRKGLWLFFQVTGAVIYWQEVARSVTSIRKSHDPLSYLDLLEVAGYVYFDCAMRFSWLFREGGIQEFFDQFQDSPLLKISSSKSTLKTVAYAVVNGWYLFTSTWLILLNWGVYSYSFDAHYETIQSMAEFYFRIPKSWSVYSWYPLLALVSFVLASQQIGNFVSADMLAVTSSLTMKHVSDDLDIAIRSDSLPDHEILELIEEQKRLTYKFNRSFGLLVAVYVLYGTPFYSLHFVNMFEIQGSMIWSSTATYAVMLGLCCHWATGILVKAQRRKRWLVKNNRLLEMDRHTLAIFLDDLTWEKYGLGSYYVVNKYVLGQIVGLILTVAMVKIQITHGRSVKD